MTDAPIKIDALGAFIHQQVDTGYVFEAVTSYCVLGETQHPFLTWAMLSGEFEPLSVMFKADIEAWVGNAGPHATIVVRTWPELSNAHDARLVQLRARLVVVNRFYHAVTPTFTPKPEGSMPELTSAREPVT